MAPEGKKDIDINQSFFAVGKASDNSMTMEELKIYIEGAIQFARSIDIPVSKDFGTDALFAYLLDLEGMLDRTEIDREHIIRVLRLMSGSVSVPTTQFARETLRLLGEEA